MGFLKDIGFPELLIILFIVLLLFGANKLPGVARSMGSSIQEFKKGMKGDQEKGQVKASTNHRVEGELPPTTIAGKVQH